MAAAGRCPLVTGVPVRFVQKIERLRLERGEPLADRLGQIHQLEASFSSTWRARNNACSTTNTSIRPMPPKSLKLTQVSVGKLYATSRLAAPMKVKKPAQLQLRRVQTPSGMRTCSPSIARTRFLRNSDWAA